MIYFIRNTVTNNAKIGTSIDPQARVKTFQTGNDCFLQIIGSVPGGRSEEAMYHAHLSRFRMDGEWFRGGPELYDAIDRILNPAPKLMGLKIESVYFAGTIRSDPWREQILGPLDRHDHWGVHDESDRWFVPNLVPTPNAARNLDYLGPFWLSTLGGNRYDNLGQHAFGDPGNHGVADRALVRSKCLSGAENCHLLFAWINSCDCFGTLAEISAAYRRWKQTEKYPIIVIATPPGFDDYEMWFVTGMARYRIDSAGSSSKAWEYLWTGDVQPDQCEIRRRFVAPVDTSRFQDGVVVFHPKYGVGRILATFGTGSDRTARIAFTVAGEKTFILAKSPLQVVPDSQITV